MHDINFGVIAREVMAALEKAGALQGVGHRARAELTKLYEKCLAELIKLRIEQELAKLGRRYEFQTLLQEDPGQSDAYLRKAIPDYLAFLLQAVSEAKQKITGCS
jgi:hypothetical protein